MATLGQWSGSAVSQFPTTSWAAPNGVFPTEDRNDGSAYSFNSTTSTITLPSSNLADGYLFVAGYENSITHNNRHNAQARFSQSSGTGNFTRATTSGYSRNENHTNCFVRTWAFVDSPSASSSYQFQWKRDVGGGSPTGTTPTAVIQVIPLYYNSVAIYESTDTGMTGLTSLHNITGWTTVLESDTTSIQRSDNAIVVKADNKRYLHLCSQFFDSTVTNRTQRWHGLTETNVNIEGAKGYSYYRDPTSSQGGDMFTWLHETGTTNDIYRQIIWRGPTTTAPGYGAETEQNTAATSAEHSWVILELNDSADVFKSLNATSESLGQTSKGLSVADTGELIFNDSNQFTGSGVTGIDVASATDVLLGANVNGGYTANTNLRFLGRSQVTIDGTPQVFSRTGDYGRGDQSTTGTFGWGSSMLSFHAVTDGQDVGIEVQNVGVENGPFETLAGHVSFWGIDLNTLEAGGTSDDLLADDAESSSEVTSPVIGQEHSLVNTGVESASEVSVPTLSQEVGLTANSVESSSETTEPQWAKNTH